jgi:hypothetical protein
MHFAEDLILESSTTQMANVDKRVNVELQMLKLSALPALWSTSALNMRCQFVNHTEYGADLAKKSVKFCIVALIAAHK